MKRIKVGVVGVGYLGRFHAEKYAAMEGAELVAIADVDQGRLEEVARKINIKGYTDYRGLIGEVEAVSIVVPTTFHYQVTREFLKHGVDVLVEKPMTCTLSEAGKLIDLANSKELILQVGHLERFNPAVLGLKDLIEKPLFIESHRLSTFKGRGIDVDVVLDLMIHDIDIILSIVKSNLKNVHAVGVPVITPNTDIANVHLQFENGCTANVTVSRISNKNMRKIRIFQPSAYISADYSSREITVIKKVGNNGHPNIESKTMVFPDGDSLEEELRAFVHAVRTRNQPVVSGEDGRRALQLALKITRQIHNHIKAKDLIKVLSAFEVNGSSVN